MSLRRGSRWGYTYSCQKCPTICQTVLDFQAHSSKFHNEPKPFKCSQCEQKFRLKWGLALHMEVHEKRRHICAFCTKGFARKGTLNVHLRIHTSREQLKKCGECGAEFTTGQGLRSHLITHSKNSDFMCTICGIATTSASNLRHHQQTHNTEKLLKCPLCPKKFASTTAFAGELTYKPSQILETESISQIP